MFSTKKIMASLEDIKRLEVLLEEIKEIYQEGLDQIKEQIKELRIIAQTLDKTQPASAERLRSYFK